MPFTVYEDKPLKGTPEVAGTDLERWLLYRGVKPEFAKLAFIFVAVGKEYGIRGDVAVCQSVLETGWFWKNNTHFDVDPKQNNYAGIGAIGGGVPGDSFPTPEIGIRAQIQSLALRAGVPIPQDVMLSSHDKENYETISGYHHTMWKQLAGTWAADETYWTQIQSIMANFNDFVTVKGEVGDPATPPPVEPPKTKGHLYRAQGPVTESFLDLVSSLLPTLLERVTEPGTTNPPTPPVPPPSTGKKVYLDPGHSPSKPGADGKSGNIHEEVQNLLAATLIAADLKAAGIEAVVFNPDPDNLSDVGNKAAGFDLALSIHHNAFDKTEHYVCMFGAKTVSPTSRMFGEAVCNAISEAIGLKSEGVKESGYTVPNIMQDVCKGPSGLIEFYFIDAYSDLNVVTEKTTKAAHATAKVIIDWLK